VLKIKIGSLLVLVWMFISLNAYATQLEVLVLYHKDFVSAKNPGTTINSYITAANSTFKNSGMSLSLKLVHHQRLDMPDSDTVGNGVLINLEQNTNVWQLQDKHRPDLTVYITNASSQFCGKARFPVAPVGRVVTYEKYISRFSAVSAVAWQSGCGASTFIHEIGHNLGAGHGAVNQDWETLGGLIDGTTKWHPGRPIPESVGHGHYNQYITIMAYPDVYGSARKIYRISNPRVSYSGLSTGTSSKNAAAGMLRLADDKVRLNSACYPAKWIKDRYGRPIRRECNNCAKWRSSYRGAKVCIETKAN